MVLTIFAGIAEFERTLSSERTSACRHAAKMKGVRFGRPMKLSIEQVALGGDSFQKVALFGIQPGSLTVTMQCLIVHLTM